MRKDYTTPWILAGMLTVFFWCRAEANEVWFVDTRSAQASSEGGIENLSLERFDEEVHQWTSSDLKTFLDSGEAGVPTVVMIHGNLMTRPEARQHGLKFYRDSKKFGRYRLVVWCWPSEKQHCKVRLDARLKSIRADTQATVLAAFLKETNRSRSDEKISLLGFSFGAKVVCNALEQLGRDPDFRKDDTQAGLKIRAVLLAAAMDCHSLLPGRSYGKALSATEEMLVHVNPEDETLRFYPMLWKLCGPQAVGKEGVALSGISLENRRKIKSVNVHRVIGETHGFMASLRGLLACRNDFRHYALFE